MRGRGFLVSVVGLLLPLVPATAASHELEGVWNRGDGNTQVRIAPCGASLCATNTWVRNPLTGEAVGDRLVMTLKRNGPGSYSGSGYQPRRDVNLTMTVKKIGAGRFSTSGCVVGSNECRSITWTAAR